MNKAIPNLVPTWDCCLCAKYYDKPNLVDGTREFSIGVKIDGNRSVCVKENGKVTLTKTQFVKTEEEVLCQSEMYSDFEVSEDAEKLLLGYAVFGFPEMIYPAWNNIVSSGVKISFDTAIKLATFLNVCGKDKNE